MKVFISTILILTSLVISISAQDTREKVAPVKIADAVLHVEVENGKTLDLTTKDLAKFTRREVKAKGHDDKDSIYNGYNLSDILLAAGAKIGKDELRGKELGSYLLVEAADGYKAIFAIAEIAPEFTDRIVLLADMRDGKPLPATEAAWQLIVPDDKKHGRWVRQVIKLSVKSVIGATAISGKISEEDLIRIIVFKKILEPWRKNSDKTMKTFYLAVNDTEDPSANILSEFANFGVSIKKLSESFISSADGDSVLNKITKEQGVLFSVSKLKWKNVNEVNLAAGSYIGNMGSDGCDYTLKKENGEWKISSVEDCVIS